MSHSVQSRILLTIAFTCAFAAGSLCGCSLSRSKVPFTGALSQSVPLAALGPEARDGILTGASSTAWFSFNPGRAKIKKNAEGRGSRGAVEVLVRNEGQDAVTISLGLVSSSDLDNRGALRDRLAARNLSTVTRVTGDLRIRMLLPDSGPDADVCGFALSLTGKETSRVSIVSASIEKAETGWQRSASSLWTGFTSEGGRIDCDSNRETAVQLVPNSLLSINLGPTAGKDESEQLGSVLRQNRVSFVAGNMKLGFRKSPAPGNTFIPSFMVRNLPVSVVPSGIFDSLSGLRVTYDKAFAVNDASNPSSPILADPSMIIEWPVSAWRRSDREVFAWDRFPSIIIFDTANYAVQDKMFKRLAFFVEKQGYRGKLLSDAEMTDLHGYNAHDYRAESLAAFFAEAKKSGFPLNPDELDLEAILAAEGIIRKDGSSWAAGAGAVISISRESESYLRYLFMAHEGFHGIYFVDPDFRAEVSSVYKSMDPRAIKYLETYFTIVDGLGYDVSDSYLMENEFMAYMMQQPEDRVAAYFTGNISERFVRYKGDPKLNEYIQSTKASEFVRAAQELNAYSFGRWGIAGGRIGLYFFD